jgi:hypothetical protein
LPSPSPGEPIKPLRLQEKRTPAAGLFILPCKQIFHDPGCGGMMNIILIVEGNQEAGIKNQHELFPHKP